MSITGSKWSLTLLRIRLSSPSLLFRSPVDSTCHPFPQASSSALNPAQPLTCLRQTGSVPPTDSASATPIGPQRLPQELADALDSRVYTPCLSWPLQPFHQPLQQIEQDSRSHLPSQQYQNSPIIHILQPPLHVPSCPRCHRRGSRDVPLPRSLCRHLRDPTRKRRLFARVRNRPQPYEAGWLVTETRQRRRSTTMVFLSATRQRREGSVRPRRVCLFTTVSTAVAKSIPGQSTESESSDPLTCGKADKVC